MWYDWCRSGSSGKTPISRSRGEPVWRWAETTSRPSGVSHDVMLLAFISRGRAIRPWKLSHIENIKWQAQSIQKRQLKLNYRKWRKYFRVTCPWCSIRSAWLASITKSAPVPSAVVTVVTRISSGWNWEKLSPQSNCNCSASQWAIDC